MRGLFKSIFLFVCFLILILAYCGFIPGLSKVFGADTPRNLSVIYAPDDAQTALRRAGIVLEELPPSNKPEETLKFSGKTTISSSFSDEEMTAVQQEIKWKYNLIPDTQIRFNDDGSVEMAGHLYTDRFRGYMKAYNISTDSIGSLLSFLSLMPQRPPYYMKFSPKMLENKLEMKIEKIQVGRYTFPLGLTISQSGAIASFIEKNVFEPIPEVYVDKLVIENGEIIYEGTFPSTIAVSHR